MANETLRAHDTYYMDGRMIILSVCGPAGFPNIAFKPISVWRKSLQSSLLALGKVQPSVVLFDRIRRQ